MLDNYSFFIKFLLIKCINLNQHPAPLPGIPLQSRHLTEGVNLPPAPNLDIQKSTRGSNLFCKHYITIFLIPYFCTLWFYFIVMFLSWDIPASELPACRIISYQIYAYHEILNNTPKTDMWKNIGCVKSLPLPMRCSLLKVNIYYSLSRIIYFLF